jgi:hypothetical protein
MPERRFPPPWSVEELDTWFVVRDANGQKLAYIYFEEEPRATISGQAAHPWDEARLLAGNRGFCNLNPWPGPSNPVAYKHQKRHTRY